MRIKATKKRVKALGLIMNENDIAEVPPGAEETKEFKLRIARGDLVILEEPKAKPKKVFSSEIKKEEKKDD